MIAVIEELRQKYDWRALLRLAGIPQSSYYYGRKRLGQDNDRYARETIRESYERSHRRYGYRQIDLDLRANGVVFNHKKIARIMHENGWKAVQPRRSKYNSYKGEVGKVSPNILDRRFDAPRPDAVWSTDVTEFHHKDGKLYLSAVKDFCTNEIVSYRLSRSPSFGFVLQSVSDAVRSHRDHCGTILHSDQGWQYQHVNYRHFLKSNGIVQSMSRKGNCLDNAKMESFFSRLKCDMWYGHEKEFETIDSLASGIEDYISWYNERRVQKKLNGLSPLQFRKQTVMI